MKQMHGISTRQIRAAILIFAFALAPMAESAATAPRAAVEVHHYREVTGDSVKEVTWQLQRGDALVLTYSSPTERHVTTTGRAYNTLRWKVVDSASDTDLIATRKENTITIEGRFKGQTVEKTLEIDACPWFQATSLSLRDLIASSDNERSFWTIRLDTLSVHKLKATKKEVQEIESGGTWRQVQRVRLRPDGFLAPFWKSDYWFTLPENVFYRFEGPSGPPGSPMTIVTFQDRT